MELPITVPLGVPELGGAEAVIKYLFYEGLLGRLEEDKKEPFKWLFFSKQDINIGK